MKSATQPLADVPSLSADQPAASAEFERESVEFFSEVAGVLGAPPSVGQIYGVVFASPKPLSFTDIVERLEISKGSASQGLHLLRALGAVRSAKVADDRREYFVAELSLRRLMDGALRERVGPLVAAAPARIARLRRLAQQDGPAKGFYLKQVGQLDTWRGRIRAALPVLGFLLGSKRKR